jgi:hypothetical protein
MNKAKAKKVRSNRDRLREAKRLIKKVLDNPGNIAHANFLRIKSAYSILSKYKGI